jgi:hypothetical protein
VWAGRILTGIDRFPTVRQGDESTNHIIGRLVDTYWWRCFWCAAPFQRTGMQYARDGRYGLLQEGRPGREPDARSYNGAFVLRS